MAEIDETIKESIEDSEPEGKGKSLNARIGLLVTVTATVMALAGIKGGMVIQESIIMQSKVNDSWALYQAKSLKAHLAENTGEILKAFQETRPARGLTARIQDDAAQDKHYAQDKEAVMEKAEAQEKTAESLNKQHERFAVTEGILSLAVALFGLAALTQRKALLMVGVTFSLLGITAALWAFFGAL